MKTFTYEQIQPLLKLSKSGPKDEGPYSMEQVHHMDYYNIVNRHGETVGQCSSTQWHKVLPRISDMPIRDFLMGCPRGRS